MNRSSKNFRKSSKPSRAGVGPGAAVSRSKPGKSAGKPGAKGGAKAGAKPSSKTTSKPGAKRAAASFQHDEAGFRPMPKGGRGLGKGKPGGKSRKPGAPVRPTKRPERPDLVADWQTESEGITCFAEMQLAEPILRALEAEGYTKPTPIQAVTIPAAMSGRDILGCAQTGTGKTAAFALPIIHQLAQLPTPSNPRAPRVPKVLVLAPTRELASQIADSFATYSKGTGLRGTTIYGGVSQRKQEAALRRGVDVIVATPGRLIDLLDQGVVDLSEIRYLAIDEADRMLDMGFIQPIRRIAGELTTDRQTLLFSATMPPKVAQLADSLLKDPVRVAVARTAEREPKIEQSLFRIGRMNDKQQLLETLIMRHGVKCGVVFTKTKHGAERVGKRLRAAGIRADAIHGNKTQAQRQRALDSLRDGRSHVLVATDVAARGLDVDGVTHVFNYDLPIEPEAYIHRIGRTGRAGATGLAIAFCSPEERGLLRAIESLLGKPIPVNHEHPETMSAAAVPSEMTGGRARRRDEDDEDDDLDLVNMEVEGEVDGERTRPQRSRHAVPMSERVMRPTPHWSGKPRKKPGSSHHHDRSNASKARTKSRKQW